MNTKITRPYGQKQTVSLTRRQSEVALMIARGAREKDIASALSLSTRTIKIFKSHIFRKLGIHSTFDLRILFFQRGLVPLESIPDPLPGIDLQLVPGVEATVGGQQ